MHTFIQYLLEAKKSVAKSSELESDDKGKLHELLLAKHLNPNKKLPSHWRSKSDDYGGTPEQVHKRLKEKVGNAAYNEIDSHAKNTAAATMQHFKNTGLIGEHEHIHDVHWTSNRDAEHNPGDHEKTTGVKDRNSNADIILTIKSKNNHKTKKFLGISAKYGSTKKPNLRNSGLASLEKDAKVPKGTYTQIVNSHENAMAKLGYVGTKKERHKQYKADLVERKTNPNGAAAKRSIAAEQSSVASRTKMADIHRKSLSTFSDNDLRNLIRRIASPKTVHPHIIAHSHVQTDGTSVARVHDAGSHVDEHLSKFHELHVDPKERGISITIKGKVKSGKHAGKIMTVAQQTFKASSGPHKGTAGSFKL